MKDLPQECSSIPEVNRLAWYEADEMLMSMNAASPLDHNEAHPRTLVLCGLGVSSAVLCLDLERIVRALHEHPEFYAGTMTPEDMCIIEG